ncbi:MAG: AtpZ/AtpI family protein [Terracidiphilus sp.]|jgi:F0F1-type ATP synthase assembly protein I
MPFNRPIPESKQHAKPVSALGSLIEAEKLGQIAFFLPSAVAVGWGAGWLADHLLHQSWITIAGVILGSVAGLVSMIRMALATKANSAGTGNGSGDGAGKGSSEREP